MDWQPPQALQGQPTTCSHVYISFQAMLQGHTLIDLTAGGTECNGGNIGGNEIIFVGSTSPTPRSATRWAQ